MRHTADSGPLLSLLGASWTDRASVTISRPKRGNPFLGPRRPSRMPGTGPFLWLMKHAPSSGFQQLPPGGMCVCAYLFVTRGGQILLPPWYTELSWQDPRSVPTTAYARGHEDVVARWLGAKTRAGPTEAPAAAR